MKKIIFPILSLIVGIIFFILYFASTKIFVSKMHYLLLGIIIAIISIIFIFYFTFNKKNERITLLENRLNVWNNISYHVSQAGDEAFNELPIGIIVYDEEFEVKWANKNCKSIFQNRLIDTSLNDLSTSLIPLIKSHESKFTFNYEKLFFEVNNNYENKILYFFDQTSRVELQTKYMNRMCAIGVITIDNLEESLKRFDVQEMSNIRGQFLGEIADYASEHECYLQGYNSDRFVMVLDRESLDKMIDNKFDILNSIREIAAKSHLKTSVSIGIACYDIDFDELGSLAQSAVELAAKRGGDQVVVNIQNEKIQYFGGKTNALEKNSLVTARIQTNALLEAIEASTNVFVTTHDMADCDALASVIGILAIAKASNKEAHAVFEFSKADSSVNKIYKYLQDEAPQILESFVKPKASDYKANSLLVVVDTQSPKIAMYPSVIDSFTNIVVIDHHRRGEESFIDPIVSYVEPYASSTVELITEMITFCTDVQISAELATVMYSGILVDTNNFTYRTGARTFEAAAILKNYGADLTTIKKVIRDDYEVEQKIAKAIMNSEIVFNKFAIALLPEKDGYNERNILAKISDSLLEIDNVEASFTIGCVEEPGLIAISSRSLDNINVQLIMEELGGGGHLNSAATQIKNITIKKAYDMLVEILKRDYENDGGEGMKVILLEDVKGRGAKNQVIDVANGYGNYLVTNKLAIVASEENIQSLNNMLAQEKEDAIAHKKLMEKLKNEIEEKSINIYIKFGADGKAFGHITTKQICDEFELQTGIKLDKRKVELASDINSVGIYQAVVNLHKDVTAHININVLEK